MKYLNSAVITTFIILETTFHVSIVVIVVTNLVSTARFVQDVTSEIFLYLI